MRATAHNLMRWLRSRKVVLWARGALLIVTGGLAVAAIVWAIFSLSSADLTRVKDGTAILGPVVVLIGLYIALRRVRVTEEGQITERFTKAIAQLGDERLPVRLGGIYALERIARDSPADHWAVMEVLCAYVREHRRERPTPAPTEPRPIWMPRPKSSRKRRKVHGRAMAMASRRPSRTDGSQVGTDIQAICDVLKRRKHKREDESQRLNLTGAHLESASLWKAHLEGADLMGAHLEGADLMDAHLEGADLMDAHLEGASLMDAHLEGASLMDAHLESASLWKAHLEGADLMGAHLEGASLWKAHLEGADLMDAHLEGASRLNTAHGDAMTLLPEGLERPAHW